MQPQTWLPLGRKHDGGGRDVPLPVLHPHDHVHHQVPLDEHVPLGDLLGPQQRVLHDAHHRAVRLQQHTHTDTNTKKGVTTHATQPHRFILGSRVELLDVTDHGDQCIVAQSSGDSNTIIASNHCARMRAYAPEPTR
jgi:hypothetical protein